MAARIWIFTTVRRAWLCRQVLRLQDGRWCDHEQFDMSRDPARGTCSSVPQYRRYLYNFRPRWLWLLKAGLRAAADLAPSLCDKRRALGRAEPCP